MPIIACLVLAYVVAICVVAGMGRALIRIPVRSDCSAYAGEPALDEAALGTLARLSGELAGVGFRALGQVVARRANGTSSVVALFVSSDETATAAILFAFAGERLLTGPLLNLVSDLSGGTKLATSNAQFAPPMPFAKGDRIARLPRVSSAAELAKVHASRVTAARAIVIPRNITLDPAALFAKLLDDDRRRLLHAGILFQSSESDYRLKWWPALRAAVDKVPPTAQLKALMNHVRATRLVGAARRSGETKP